MRSRKISFASNVTVSVGYVVLDIRGNHGTTITQFLPNRKLNCLVGYKTSKRKTKDRMIARFVFSPPDPEDILEINFRNESVKFHFQIITLIEAV